MLVPGRVRSPPVTASGSSTPPGSRRSWSKRSTGIFDVNELRIDRGDRAARERHRHRDAADGHAAGRRPLRGDRITGSFVLIDELTFATIAAGMVGPPRLHD